MPLETKKLVNLRSFDLSGFLRAFYEVPIIEIGSGIIIMKYPWSTPIEVVGNVAAYFALGKGRLGNQGRFIWKASL